MALSYSRVLCRSGLNLQNMRSFYMSAPSKILASQTLMRTTAAPVANESFIERNKKLGRPLSPHLGIYKFQITMTLSLSHRTTGIILTSYAVILGFGTLFCPGGIDTIIGAIAAWNLSPATLIAGKALFAYPVTFHFFNGMRHLAWDLGKYLSIKHVYSTGYTAVALSAISAIALAFM
uniref:Succinate dehydrogenase cytochrome b560 subunit, mitochondrial n=1 Tax=Trichogramma kaykai TaxID=54128 RepID=A0ABD2XE63_9HYME